MTKEEFVALFPIKANITQEIINNSTIYSVRNCIGANTLKSVLSPEIIKELNPSLWGNISGCAENLNREWRVHITTEENIQMMNINKPQECTFIVLHC